MQILCWFTACGDPHWSRMGTNRDPPDSLGGDRELTIGIISVEAVIALVAPLAAWAVPYNALGLDPSALARPPSMTGVILALIGLASATPPLRRIVGINRPPSSDGGDPRGRQL